MCEKRYSMMQYTRVVLAAIVPLYFLGYFLLMVPNCPALDSTMVAKGRTSYRFSIVEMRYKGILVLVGEFCWLNVLYAPLDSVYYYFFPPTVQLGLSWGPAVPPSK